MTSQGQQPEEQQQPPTTTPVPKTPALVVSPSPSRESSPTRQLLSPPAPQPTRNSRLRTQSDGLPALRLPNSSPGTINGSSHPKNSSMNETTGKGSKSESNENGGASNGNNSSTMRWPTSPRLKSPPTSTNSRRNSSSSSRISDQENAESELASQSGRAHLLPLDLASKSPVMNANTNAPTGLKNPRGFSGLTSTLETVQEGDQSSSPNNDRILSSVDGEERPFQVEKEPSDGNLLNTSPERSERSSLQEASEADVDYSKTNDTLKDISKDTAKDGAKDSPKAGTGQTQTSARKTGQSTAAPKVRSTAEGSSKNMTVETETVASIPQSSANVNNAERSGPVKKEESGSVRANPSSEAAKPKKEKKKSNQKRPAAASGQSTSKADIFEAKVTSAAEDDDSDSDETFVYESNPQENRTRPARNHSRTPSANSTRSLTDRKPGSRPLGNLVDAQRGVRAKRSMKFASNSYTADDEGPDREQGTVRANRNKNGSSSGHHHMHGFSKDNQQPAGEEESPFSQASKLRNANGFRSSKGPSPRSSSPPPYSRTPTKGDQTSSFDYDSGRALSEQDPLLGSVRSPHSRPLRGSNLRYGNSHSNGRSGGRASASRSYVRRCAGCAVVVTVIVSVLVVAFAFLFATTHPLYDVALLDIKNILATEDSLMADLECIATNPNIVPIGISHIDVNIFAKARESKTTSSHSHARPTPSPQKHATHHHHHHHQHHRQPRRLRPRDNVDDGTDPIAEDPATLLLGRVFSLDTSLSFDASPLRHLPDIATGSLRLDRPGNGTDEDGPERWERILQSPFDLILRGVLKYTLPFSSRVVTSSVGQRVRVEPEE